MNGLLELGKTPVEHYIISNSGIKTKKRGKITLMRASQEEGGRDEYYRLDSPYQPYHRKKKSGRHRWREEKRLSSAYTSHPRKLTHSRGKEEVGFLVLRYQRQRILEKKGKEKKREGGKERDSFFSRRPAAADKKNEKPTEKKKEGGGRVWMGVNAAKRSIPSITHGKGKARRRRRWLVGSVQCREGRKRG